VIANRHIVEKGAGLGRVRLGSYSILMLHTDGVEKMTSFMYCITVGLGSKSNISKSDISDDDLAN